MANPKGSHLTGLVIMKPAILSFIILFFLFSCAPVQVAPTLSLEKDIFYSKNWNVAVLDLNYEFEGEGEITGGTFKSAGKDGGNIVAGILAAELGNIDNLIMVERDQINNLLNEQALQQSGMIDVESGRILFYGAISCVKSYVEPFSNVQLTTKEFVDTIKKY